MENTSTPETIPSDGDAANDKPKPTKKLITCTKASGKSAKSAAASNQEHHHSTTAPPEDEHPFAHADATKWKYSELIFSGSATYMIRGKKEKIKRKSIKKGIEHFKANPTKYTAMLYQTNMLERSAGDHKYEYIHREGTVGFTPEGVDPKGWETCLLHEYQRLPSFENNDLPMEHRDKYTDHTLSYWGLTMLPKPVMPGRLMGCADAPNLKIIGDVDPSDVNQGRVANCWLLSGISALAEFDGAVKRLFRKTKDLDQRPFDGPNMYTVTLWDLEHWKEVDILIDERLCGFSKSKLGASKPNGQLLASKPSADGELWVCYLEKAMAAHCGGWDKVSGGQCTHAWALLTGCKFQYMINKNKKTGLFMCSAKYDSVEKEWMPQSNSPHDCDNEMWPCAWPEVGGGGDGVGARGSLPAHVCMG